MRMSLIALKNHRDQIDFNNSMFAQISGQFRIDAKKHVCLKWQFSFIVDLQLI